VLMACLCELNDMNVACYVTFKSNMWRHELTLDSESRFAGSAGTVNSTVRVSTAMTPRGMPPNLF